MKHIVRTLVLLFIIASLATPSAIAQKSKPKDESLDLLNQKLEELEQRVKDLESELKKINRDTTAFDTSGPTGYVSVYSNKNSEVYIDEQFVGNTPLTYQLPVGAHEIKVIDARTKKEKVGSISIIDNQDTRFDANF